MPERTLVEADGTPFTVETDTYGDDDVPRASLFAYDGSALQPVKCDTGGVLETKDTVAAPYMATQAVSSGTPAAFGSQAVVGPVTVTLDKDFDGELTLDHGSGTGIQLYWDAANGRHNPVVVLACVNLSQIRYSVNGGSGGDIYVHAGT